ncbi:MAG: hypothetical protein LUC85_06490 [Bacteroidales bacterium]|nr:hypothetical protein [Bacteroidales bacterium]MCD8394467.1 hypothetical protein [Bacteroidales bacterium]
MTVNNIFEMREEKKNRIEVLALTLVGLALPLGNIWGPWLVNFRNEEILAFRKKVTVWQSVVTALLIIVALGLTINAMSGDDINVVFLTAGVSVMVAWLVWIILSFVIGSVYIAIKK